MSGMTVFDSILIWDKIMTMEQRKELITNCWSVDKKIIEYDHPEFKYETKNVELEFN